MQTPSVIIPQTLHETSHSREMKIGKQLRDHFLQLQSKANVRIKDSVVQHPCLVMVLAEKVGHWIPVRLHLYDSVIRPVTKI